MAANIAGGQASSDFANPTKPLPCMARVSEETCNAPGHHTIQKWPLCPMHGSLLTDTRSVTTLSLFTSGCSALRKVESTLSASHSMDTTLCISRALLRRNCSPDQASLQSTAFSLLLTVSRAARAAAFSVLALTNCKQGRAAVKFSLGFSLILTRRDSTAQVMAAQVCSLRCGPQRFRFY